MNEPKNRTMNKTWSFADIAVNATFNCQYLAKQCRSYESNERAALSIELSEDDILLERERNTDGSVYSDGYYESLAFYRKLAVASLDENVLLLHGSAIRFRRNGYIYIAPSGVGKSTHTRLCKELFGNEVTYINDDKPLLRLVGGTWYVYGTPWDGKHRLSENIRVPLASVCALERGEENSIQRRGYDDALRALMTQIYRPDDGKSMKKTLDLLLSLAKVPFWQLRCNISEEAARLSLETMSAGE